MFGELIIMIVYLPILTLHGVEGQLFRPMALTVIFALVGSLILSLTVMPVLASLLLPRKVEERDPLVVRLARWLYAPVLALALRQRVAVLALAACAVATAVMMALSLGSEFVPRLSEGALVVGILRPPGTALDESLRYNSRMEQVLLAAFPNEVRHVWSRCGTAEVATDPMGPEETDFFIALYPREHWTCGAHTQAELTELIAAEFADMPGQKLSYTQPIEQRVQEMISGVRADVAVKLFGDDFEELTKTAAKIQAVLEKVDGQADLSTEQLIGQGVVQVRVRPDQLARHGVSARTVLELVESLGGRPQGDILEGQLRFPLVVRLPDRLGRSPEAIGSILVGTPAGERVPLSRLADIEVSEGPVEDSARGRAAPHRDPVQRPRPGPGRVCGRSPPAGGCRGAFAPGPVSHRMGRRV